MIARIAPAGPPPAPVPQPARGAQAAPGSFAEELARATTGNVRLSGHAQERLASAHRQLSPEELARLSQALDDVAAKGGRQSLVVMHDLALVVSVPTRTVVTAVDQSRMRGGLFTRIDSAVVI